MNAEAAAIEQRQIQNAQVPGVPAEGVSSTAPVSPLSSPPAPPAKDIIIKKATFGDETSSTDVTKTLMQQLDEYEYIDVTADQSLIPVISWGGSNSTRLTRDEQLDAQSKAEDECGGAQNKSCIEVRKQQHMQKMLRQKEDKSVASDKIVKGRRLTVTYVDANGQEQTVIVPDGNQFKVGEPKKGEVNPFGVTEIFKNGVLAIITIVTLFGWVYSVVATYRTMLEAGYRVPGYIATAVAIFIPYSGYFIMLAFFAIKSFAGVDLSVPKPELLQTIAKRPGATVASVIS